MPSGSDKDMVIWSVIAVAVVGFVGGMQFSVAVQKSMAGEQTHMVIFLLLLAVLIFGVVVTIRRILKALR